MWRNTQYSRQLHDACFKLLYGQPKKIIQRSLNGPISWPFYQRAVEKEKLHHFVSYQENIFKQPVNSKNTLFVVGAQGCGKSWFMKNTCKNAIIIENHHINFDSFFKQLKSEIIDFICRKQLITLEDVQQIVLSKYSPEYLNIYFNQFIRDQLNIEQISALTKSNQQIILPNIEWEGGELEFWQEDATQLKQNIKSPFSFVNTFVSLSELLDNNDLLKSSIELALSIVQQIEIDRLNNPIEINNVTGAQQQVDLLFDILNYISGFDKQSKKKAEIALVLLNTDKLLEYYRYDSETIDFFDHLILKTYNQTGIRNHFPIVIESSNSKFYNRDMMEMMNIELNTVLHLDIFDIDKEQIAIQVDGIFSEEEIDQIYQVIGGSLQEWHRLTKNAVSNNDFSIDKWLQSQLLWEQNKFNNKMNFTVLNNEISEMLDDHQIDAKIFRIMNAFQFFKGIMFTGNYYADVLLMENSIVHALQQEGVLYHPKYKSHLFFSKPCFNRFCKAYLEKKKKQLSFWPKDDEDEDILVPAFRLDRKQRGGYLKQISDEPRKYIYDDIRKEERPYHEYYV